VWFNINVSSRNTRAMSTHVYICNLRIVSLKCYNRTIGTAPRAKQARARSPSKKGGLFTLGEGGGGITQHQDKLSN